MFDLLSVEEFQPLPVFPDVESSRHVFPAGLAHGPSRLFISEEIRDARHKCVDIPRLNQQAGHTVDHCFSYTSAARRDNWSPAAHGLQRHEAEWLICNRWVHDYVGTLVQDGHIGNACTDEFHLVSKPESSDEILDLTPIDLEFPIPISNPLGVGEDKPWSEAFLLQSHQHTDREVYAFPREEACWVENHYMVWSVKRISLRSKYRGINGQRK